jgi:superfamily II DNA/RNA helicase
MAARLSSPGVVVGSFAEFGLLPSLQASLVEQGLVTPTEIQSRTIPALVSGRSVVGVAETGSGKTLSYALPVLQLTKSLEDEGTPVTVAGQPRALVIVPTRELGEQVAKVFKTFTHTTRLRVRSVLGGTTMEIARRGLNGPLEVLIATPGRLIQLLDQRAVSLADLRFIVLDEADQLLDLGFQPDVVRIVEGCPATRQLALFSATVSPAVETLIGRLFADPVVIKSTGSHRIVASLTTINQTVRDGKRFELLLPLLSSNTEGGTLIFANTREQCDKIAKQLDEAGHPCVIYRGEMSKVERRANLKSFRDGEISVLVSTDLGARGLDVESVGRVINYHLPHKLENYLHRVGRTARAGRPGVVVNFVTERDERLVAQFGQIQPPRR